MFIDNSIPATYNKIAEINNNYIVLVKESFLTSDASYDAYVQFYNPSVMVLHLVDYKIKSGNKIISDYDISASGDIFSSESIYALETSSLDDISSDFYDRPDLPHILYSQFLLVFLFVWLLNQLSKLIKKGGVFTS